MSDKTILEARHLDKYFYEPVKFHVLKDINITVEEGEFVSIVGSSGSGKSTLLYTLSSLDTDYDGKVIIDRIALDSLDSNQLARLRNRAIGFIFQSHYLLKDFTAIGNVMLPGLKLGTLSKEDLRKAALDKMDLLGIRDQADKAINTLSGGQQQRVAIARALINNPKIIFCDEPTGNLDSKNARIVFDLLKELAHGLKQTIVMVTHDESYKTDRQIRLHDGAVIS
ncbi:MAG TPA: ABC transporter ATP-binding protein [Chryseosolibacter sp.]